MFIFIVVLQVGTSSNVNVIRKRLDSPHPSGLMGLRGSTLQQVLNWGMIISASMRSTLQASMETNEAGGGQKEVAATKTLRLHLPNGDGSTAIDFGHEWGCTSMTLIFFDVNIEGTRVVINSRMVRGRETFVTISLYSAHSGHFPLHGQSLAVNAEFVCDFPAPFLLLHQSSGGREESRTHLANGRGAAILLPSLKDYLRYHFYGADVTFEPPYESSRFVKKIGDALQLCI